MTSRGFAFCEYTEERGVMNAIKYLNGMKVMGRQINVRKTQGNAYVVPVGQMTEVEKRVFSTKIEDYIELVEDMVVKGEELRS